MSVRNRPKERCGGAAIRLLLAAVVALVSIVSYCSTRTHNPVTDEEQYVGLEPDEEIALGLQALPQMTAQHDGLHPDQEMQDRVDKIGQRIVQRSAAREQKYPYEFHVLRDEQTINAFALPGGQVFITAGLLKRLNSDDEVAGVLAHEIGHVAARHGAEHLSKAQLTQGLAGAAVIASYDPDNPRTGRNAAIAMAISQLVTMKYGRDDELESDRLAVQFTGEAGYDPRGMIALMRVLAEASRGRAPPEFFSTHPNPENRIEKIRLEIQRQWPNGIPGLKAEAESQASISK